MTKQRIVVEENFSGMGTDLGVVVVTEATRENDARGAIAVARQRLAGMEEIFSRFLPESELSAHNASCGTYRVASAEFCHIARAALRYHALTAGLYDPRVIGHLERFGYATDFRTGSHVPASAASLADLSRPLSDDLDVRGSEVRFGARMDFAGIVKGYAADRVAVLLARSGFPDHLVDMGGDVRTGGRPADSERWHIAIEGVPAGQLVLAFTDGALATSGVSRRKWEQGGKRFHHLVDPRNPEAQDFTLRTVSVVTTEAIDADVWAKTLFLLGKDAGLAYAKERAIAALFLDYSGNVTVTPALAQYRAR